ncbi:MAG TPA: zinc metallopeptidase, partial [Lentimicrobium sp.]|nr:zinc metallopeptidase [Lentimicrobium sp.]
MGYLLIFGVFMLISWAVGARLKSRFREYSKIPVNYGLSGREIAEKMLRESGVDDVQVVSVQGELSDHYNPMTKTVNLSPDVYHGRSISAAAVAAHECGHAVQHATAYAWLMMRSKLVPVVSFASNWVQWVLLAGILLVNTFPGLLLAGGSPPEGGNGADLGQQNVDAEFFVASSLEEALGTTGTSYNVSSFVGKGGKHIFYHGESDAWFSANETVRYMGEMGK